MPHRSKREGLRRGGFSEKPHFYEAHPETTMAPGVARLSAMESLRALKKNGGIDDAILQKFADSESVCLAMAMEVLATHGSIRQIYGGVNAFEAAEQLAGDIKTIFIPRMIEEQLMSKLRPLLEKNKELLGLKI